MSISREEIADAVRRMEPDDARNVALIIRKHGDERQRSVSHNRESYLFSSLTPETVDEIRNYVLGMKERKQYEHDIEVERESVISEMRKTLSEENVQERKINNFRKDAIGMMRTFDDPALKTLLSAAEKHVRLSPRIEVQDGFSFQKRVLAADQSRIERLLSKIERHYNERMKKSNKVMASSKKSLNFGFFENDEAGEDGEDIDNPEIEEFEIDAEMDEAEEFGDDIGDDLDDQADGTNVADACSEQEGDEFDNEFDNDNEYENLQEGDNNDNDNDEFDEFDDDDDDNGYENFNIEIKKRTRGLKDRWRKIGIKDVFSEDESDTTETDSEASNERVAVKKSAEKPKPKPKTIRFESYEDF